MTVNSPRQSGFLYSILQALDEQHLGVDAQLGGVDQRNFFTFAEEYLPKMGYMKRSHLINPVVPGLTGGKMSSSIVNSKIDFLDSREDVERKFMSCICSPYEPDNYVMTFVNYVVYPILDIQGKIFTLENGTKFRTFELLKEQLVTGKVEGKDVTKAAVIFLNKLLDSIRKEFNSREMKQIIARAYPKTLQNLIPRPMIPTSGKPQVVEEPEVLFNINTEKRLALLKRNLLQCPPEYIICEIINKKYKILWEVNVTDKPSIDILVHLAKIRDFVSIDCNVTILVNDVLSHLNGGEVSLPVASCRADYFIALMKSTCDIYSIPINKITFIKGSEFQLKQEYVKDIYKMATHIECTESSFATALALKNNSLISSLLYPNLATINEKFLKCEVHYMSSNWKPLSEYSQKFISIINCPPKIYLYDHSMPTYLFSSPEMNEGEYIELIEEESQLKKKLEAAFCEEGNVAFNPILCLVRNIILPVLGGESFEILMQNTGKGENLEISDIESLTHIFKSKNLHSDDLKNAVFEQLRRFISPIRTSQEGLQMENNEDLGYASPE